MAVISDINGRYGSSTYHQRIPVAIERIIALKPDLVISTGDMVAGQRLRPPLSQAELDTMWDNFDAQIREPLEAAGIPLLMTPGNHDASAHPGFEHERATYNERQADHPPNLPVFPGGNFPYHYATSLAGVLFISLDATTSDELTASQREWLARQLENAGHYRSVVLFGHLPLQPVTIGRERDIITDEKLEALLRDATNTIYLSGHHHAYYPGWRDGLHMLSVGNLGGNQRSLVGTAQKTGFSFSWLEIDGQGDIAVSAYRGPLFLDAIANESLPENLTSARGTLVRRDLVQQAAPDHREQTRCHLSATAQSQAGEQATCTLHNRRGDLAFQLETSGTGSITRLHIAPSGLTEVNEIIVEELEGSAYGAELADLDNNGWPEIYVYVSSAGSGSYGSLIAYAVNNGKSMTPIYLPPLEQTPEAIDGYMGHDEFAVVENRLERRFPIYREGDTNSAPTGGVRQLQYRLEPGEAGWVLSVDRIAEY